MSSESGKNGSDKCFHFIPYTHCIYLLAVIGILSQVGVACHNIIYLKSGHGFGTEELEYIAELFSVIGIVVLIGSAISEMGLVPAVSILCESAENNGSNKQLQLCVRYIQWWMTFMMLLCIFSTVMTAVAGFSLYEEDNQSPAFWIGGSYLLPLVRVPIQMYFVDRFAQCKIFHKELHTND